MKTSLLMKRIMWSAITLKFYVNIFEKLTLYVNIFEKLTIYVMKHDEIQFYKMYKSSFDCLLIKTRSIAFFRRYRNYSNLVAPSKYKK